MGFDDQKLEKITAQNKINISLSKIAINLSPGVHKDVKVTGETFSLQKRTSSTSKHEIS
jgi:hypothetical protein